MHKTLDFTEPFGYNTIMEKAIKQANLQIRGEFNNCPGADALKQYMYEFRIAEYIEYMDVDDKLASYWQNDPATMVIALKEDAPKNTGLAIGRMAIDNNADEMHFRVFDGRTLVRLWWD